MAARPIRRVKLRASTALLRRVERAGRRGYPRRRGMTAAEYSRFLAIRLEAASGGRAAGPSVADRPGTEMAEGSQASPTSNAAVEQKTSTKPLQLRSTARTRPRLAASWSNAATRSVRSVDSSIPPPRIFPLKVKTIFNKVPRSTRGETGIHLDFLRTGSNHT